MPSTNKSQTVWRREKNVYDFPDFSSIVNSKGIAVETEVSDFSSIVNSKGIAVEMEVSDFSSIVNSKGIAVEMEVSDFSSIVNSKGIAVETEVSDFKEYESKLSKAKCTNYPLLENVIVVRFVHGSEKIYRKENMDATDFISGYFLQNKFVQAMMKRNPFLQRASPKGFPFELKNELMKNLCPLMEENRWSFWENLPLSNDVIKSSFSNIFNSSDDIPIPCPKSLEPPGGGVGAVGRGREANLRWKTSSFFYVFYCWQEDFSIISEVNCWVSI